MVTLPGIIDEVLAGIVTSVLGWLFTKILPIMTRKKVDMYQLTGWAMRFILPLIPIAAYLRLLFRKGLKYISS